MNIIRMETTISTNDEARRMGIDGAADRTVVVADEQTGGRGRLGREWSSPRGGLWMSMIARPPVEKIEEMPLFSIAAGVAVAEGLEKIFDELEINKRPRLGWPNDVLIGDKKIAGILCESHRAADGAAFAVIGTGLNLNNMPEDLPRGLAEIATSVKALGGKEYDRDTALEIIAGLLNNRVADIIGGCREKTLDAWRERSALFGRLVSIQSPGSDPRTATPFGLDGRGRLLVREENGGETAVEFEETTLLR